MGIITTVTIRITAFAQRRFLLFSTVSLASLRRRQRRHHKHHIRSKARCDLWP